MGVGSDVVIKRSRSLSHLLMSSCFLHLFLKTAIGISGTGCFQNFLWVGCDSCHLTNSVKALKETQKH